MHQFGHEDSDMEMSTISAPAFASNGANDSFGASLRTGAEDVDLEGNEQETCDYQGVGTLDLEASGADELDLESKSDRSPRGDSSHPKLMTSSSGIVVIERGP